MAEFPLPGALLGVRRGPPGDMVDRAGAGNPLRGVGQAKDVHNGSRPAGADFEAMAAAFFLGRAKTEGFGKKERGPLIALLGEGGTVDSADGVLGRDPFAGRG